MGVPTREVGYTTPPPEGIPRSSGEHAVALEKRKKKERKKKKRKILNLGHSFAVNIKIIFCVSYKASHPRI
jgi:3-dehydroquinate synthetase